MITEKDAAEPPRLTEVEEHWREYAADYGSAAELDATVEGLISRGARGDQPGNTGLPGSAKASLTPPPRTATGAPAG
ncbi:hypothetical protein AMK21_13720 [Streptomyces sp. CB00316]|uniref:hypothetical protein n=1 Tax=Streptomyces sp. CB00316 TaxID=1703932 RepID=UPI00095B40B4|nr:hypothetical protein [Streptomyces sp. CB00316]OKJ20976.1 hypothetical protein AMK21_13720 [Streptomyces sp. CB00316]